MLDKDTLDNSVELRILEELTFIAEHIVSLEKQFQELLTQVKANTARMPFRAP